MHAKIETSANLFGWTSTFNSEDFNYWLPIAISETKQQRSEEKEDAYSEGTSEQQFYGTEFAFYKRVSRIRTPNFVERFLLDLDSEMEMEKIDDLLREATSARI